VSTPTCANISPWRGAVWKPRSRTSRIDDPLAGGPASDADGLARFFAGRCRFLSRSPAARLALPAKDLGLLPPTPGIALALVSERPFLHHVVGRLYASR
jgi:hypothetical protein